MHLILVACGKNMERKGNLIEGAKCESSTQIVESNNMKTTARVPGSSMKTSSSRNRKLI